MSLKFNPHRFLAWAELPVVAALTLLCPEAPAQQITAPAAVSEVRLIPYRKGDKWGYSDRQKKLIIQPKYEGASDFSEGLGPVALKGKWGFIDGQGQTVIPFKYDEVWGFSEGVSRAQLNNKWGLIDRSGKEVIPVKYD